MKKLLSALLLFYSVSVFPALDLNRTFNVDEGIAFNDGDVVVGDDAGALVLRTNNTERSKILSTGETNITGTGNYTPLKIKEHASLTGNVFEINNSADANLFSVGSIGLLDIDLEAGLNMAPAKKHTIALGNPTTVESGSTFHRIFSDDLKIQSRASDPNGLTISLFDITTEDTVVDVTSPGLNLVKMILTNEQDIDSIVGNVPIMGFNLIYTNNSRIIGQPNSGFSDSAGTFRLVQNGIQEMADFSFNEGRGLNVEMINNYDINKGKPIIVQLGIDALVDMTGLTITGTGAPSVLSQKAGQFRCFGTTAGIGSDCTAGFFSATGGSSNFAIDVSSGVTRIGGDFDHNGSNIGFFGSALAAQTAAYTQTFSTATRTHSNFTSATLTDSSGGTANTTVVAVSGSGDDATINDNFADLAAQNNALRVDVDNLKQLVNSLIDDSQIYGLAQ